MGARRLGYALLVAVKPTLAACGWLGWFDLAQMRAPHPIFAFVPVLLGAVTIVLMAMAVHRLVSGKAYPHP